MFPGVYAKITDNVKKWIKDMTTGTQDNCYQSRDYFFWRGPQHLYALYHISDSDPSAKTENCLFLKLLNIYLSNNLDNAARLKKMKKSDDFEAEDVKTNDDDQTNPIKIRTEANKNDDNSRAKVSKSKTSEGVDPNNSEDRKQSSNRKKENDLSYVHQLLALLQAQGKM